MIKVFISKMLDGNYEATARIDEQNFMASGMTPGNCLLLLDDTIGYHIKNWVGLFEQEFIVIHE